MSRAAVAGGIAAELFGGACPERARRWYRVGLIEARECGDRDGEVAFAIGLQRVAAADARVLDRTRLERSAAGTADARAAVEREILLRTEVLLEVEPGEGTYERALADAAARADAFAVAEAFDRLAETAIVAGNAAALRAARDGALRAVHDHGPLWRLPYQAALAAHAAWLAGDAVTAAERLALATSPQTMLGRLAVAAVVPQLEGGAIVDELFVGAALRRGAASVAAAYVAAVVDARVRADEAAAARELLDPRVVARGQVDALALVLRVPSAARDRDVERAARLVAEWRRTVRGRGANAYFALFDALYWRRDRRRRKMRAAATEAATRFADCGWPMLERVAIAVRDGMPPEIPLFAHAGTRNGAAGTEPAVEPEVARDAPALTQREREVTRLVIEGLKNREIGMRLGISEHTVEHHITAILAKLRLASRWQIRERAHSDSFPDLS